MNLPAPVSDTFDPTRWRTVDGFEDLTDLTYHRGVARRPADRRPSSATCPWSGSRSTGPRCATRSGRTRSTSSTGCSTTRAPPRRVGTVLLTGNGPAPKDGVWSFCSGGDQRIRGRDGYRYAEGETSEGIDPARAGRLHILEVQRLIRTMPKVVVALVNGWAAGGGHSLHVVADLTIASREHARFMQTDANVGSFDGGYGSALLARQVGQKRAREIFFLAREYSAEQALAWGAVNDVVAHDDLEEAGLEYARIIATKSPQAVRMLKFAFNLADDGLAGQQVFAGEATRLAYMTDEAVEGRDAFLQRRDPDWSGFPYAY